MDKLKAFSFCSFFLALAILIVLIIITGISGYREYPEKYDALQEKYSELEEKYDNTNHKLLEIQDDIWSRYDDFSTVWCYFEKEEGISFDDAKESFMKIYYTLNTD